MNGMCCFGLENRGKAIKVFGHVEREKRKKEWTPWSPSMTLQELRF